MQNILIVDDDATFCLMLKSFLEKKGFSVKEAFSFSEALKNIKSSTFDVILTDIRLPDRDGLELLREAKAKSPHTSIFHMNYFYCNYSL